MEEMAQMLRIAKCLKDVFLGKQKPAWTIIWSAPALIEMVANRVFLINAWAITELFKLLHAPVKLWANEFKMPEDDASHRCV